MVVTVPVLQAHIDRMNKGFLDFSQCELNTRADLVRFEGFTLEKACSIDESEAYAIMEGETIEKPVYENQYGITCKCCGKPVAMEYTDSPSDGYQLNCENSHYDFVSIYVFDN